jgi:hypothetical protein
MKYKPPVDYNIDKTTLLMVKMLGFTSLDILHLLIDVKLTQSATLSKVMLNCSNFFNWPSTTSGWADIRGHDQYVLIAVSK